ncbi:rrna methylase [hydrocarbon metagenome]|uniref:Rrna methylase n=1 Tax=hydrocarbon metagenome TaxID=938273 RepID=A0A0W8E8I5_9ZZZZ
MKEIKSRDNQKIRDAARLKEQKYRHRDQMFLIEGRTLFSEAVKGQQELLRVFVERETAEQYLDEFRKTRDIEWVKVDHTIMKHICDTQTPQGIVAVARIPEWDLHNIVQEAGFLLFLDHIGDPGNMGTIFRTAWAFGVQGVLLSRGCVDPFNPKVVRSSMGAVFNVPVFIDVSAEGLVRIKEEGYRILASSLDTDLYIDRVDFTGPVVIIIGSEARGVSPKILNVCDHSFKIPLITPVDSLNAGVACGIIIYEAGKQRGISSFYS